MTKLERALLLTILHQAPGGYGVSIRRELNVRLGRSISVGWLYVALYRLEKQGFISSRPGEPRPERGGYRRYYYTVEPAGRSALVEDTKAILATIDAPARHWFDRLTLLVLAIVLALCGLALVYRALTIIGLLT